MQPSPHAQPLWQRPGTGQLFTKVLESQRLDGETARAKQAFRLRIKTVSVESPWLLVLDR